MKKYIIGSLFVLAILLGVSLFSNTAPISSIPVFIETGIQDAASPITASPTPIPTVTAVYANALSDAQLQFVAKKYHSIVLGENFSQAETIKKLHQYNPNLIVLIYINSRHVVKNGIRYGDAITSPVDLFAYDALGNKITEPRWNEYLMDIYKSEWADKIAEWRIAMPDADGIMLDEANPTLTKSNYTALPVNYNSASYTSRMKQFFSDVQNKTTGLVIFNGLKDGVKTTGYTDGVDGGALEGFVFNENLQNVDSTRTMNHINAILAMGQKQKTASAIAKIPKENISNRVFALGAYLLGSSDFTTYTLVLVGPNSKLSQTLEYYPEYEVDLGKPLTAPSQASDLYNAEQTLLIRTFEKGLVIVNPSPTATVSYQLASDYMKVTPIGGGVVDANGSIDSSLQYDKISAGMVNIDPGTALILSGIADTQ